MGFLIKIFKPLLKRKANKLLSDENYQQKIVNLVNKKIDIPNIDEKAEEVALNQIYDTFQLLLKDFIEEL